MELQEALLNLVELYRLEGLISRRHEILEARRQRFYWQGNQFIFYDFENGDFATPPFGLSTRGDATDQQSGPRFNYVFNVYQPFGLAFIAVFSSQVPTTTYRPQSINRSEDITAAKAFTEASLLIDENNNIQQKQMKIGRYLWTDGKVGGYVRFVRDAQRFGTEQIESLDQAFAKIGDDGYTCPACGQFNPEANFAQMGPNGQPQMNPQRNCPGCGQPLGDEDFKPAPRVEIPVNGEASSVAKGQEVIDFYGSLELATPVYANEQDEFPFIQLQFEVHKAKLKAAYPQSADKIESTSPLTAEDQYARASRLAVSQGMPVLHPGDAMYNLVTYQRTWLRPWAFNNLGDKDIVKQLCQIFPKGCYVAFAGRTYCESRNESMDDHWRVMHALPGDGQNRPSMGRAAVDLQDQVNTLANMTIETYEYGIPPIYADPETIDFEALHLRQIEPGVHVPARAKAGQTLAGSFFQPQAASVPKDMQQYLQELIGPYFQLVTGITAAVFGQSMEDVKTASAYAQARDMAMGRLGLVWNNYKQFKADLSNLGVKIFRENRTGDIEHVLPGENSEFEAKTIRVADLQGNVTAHADPDETYPRLRTQKEAIVQQLMQSEDPEIAAVLADPINMGLIKGILGLDDFVLPGEQARLMQLREIEQMLKGGSVLPPMQFQNHAVHIAEIKRWVESDDGQAAEQENIQGYQAVEQHAQLHQLFLMQQMAPMLPQAAPMGKGEGKPGPQLVPQKAAPEPNL